MQYPTHDYTLNGLVKYVNYEVKIIAFNSIGEGPASTITSVYVGEAGMTCEYYLQKKDIHIFLSRFM